MDGWVRWGFDGMEWMMMDAWMWIYGRDFACVHVLLLSLHFWDVKSSDWSWSWAFSHLDLDTWTRMHAPRRNIFPLYHGLVSRDAIGIFCLFIARLAKPPSNRGDFLDFEIG
jgi:hypothetical protein